VLVNSIKFNGDNYVLELTRGDTAILEFRFVDDDGQPSDLSNFEILMTAKEWTNDADAESKFQLEPFEHEDADLCNGIVYFKIRPENTKTLEYKKYSFDVQIKDGDDIWTPIVAYLMVKKEIKF